LTCQQRSQLFFQIWSEADGSRGCGEVASSILAFIDASGISSDANGSGHFIAWSDCCSGQNKNFFIICLWQYLVQSGKFKLIDHKFPESGHSYMDSDRDFGHIEKKVREVGNIYSIDQYQDIMAQSQVKAKPQITRMQGNLYDIKSLPESLGLTHRKITTDGEPVRFRDGMKWIRVEEFGSYKYKESLDEEAEWKTVDLRKTDSAMTGHTLNISDYCTKVSGHIKKPKKVDISKQMKYIPDI